MYIFLLPPAGAEEAPEEPRLLDEERRAVHRGARLDHPRARPANIAAFTFWGHCGEYIRDDDLIYKHCVCGACKYTGLIIASVGIVLSGELSMIANIIKMFGSVMKYFCDCQCILLK